MFASLRLINFYISEKYPFGKTYSEKKEYLIFGKSDRDRYDFFQDIMIAEEECLELNFENCSNLRQIEPSFKRLKTFPCLKISKRKMSNLSKNALT